MIARSVVIFGLMVVALAGCEQRDPLSPCLARGYQLDECRSAYSVYGSHDPSWMDGVPSFAAGMGTMALLNYLHNQPRYNTPAYQGYWNSYQSDPNGYTQRYAPPVRNKTVINNYYGGSSSSSATTVPRSNASPYSYKPPASNPSSSGSQPAVKPQPLFKPNTIAPNRSSIFGGGGSGPKPSFGTNRAGKK